MSIKSSNNMLRPNTQVAQRIEELLQEQLYEMGVDIKKLKADEITKYMKCHVGPDYSMTYFWKNRAILDVVPENKDHSIIWRMFTKEDIQDTKNSYKIKDNQKKEV